MGHHYHVLCRLEGEVRVASRIDYEATPSLNFTLVAYDSGVPQLSSSAAVFVEVVNINDERPEFSADLYNATVEEHSTPGTSVLNVSAVDLDAGGAVYLYMIKQFPLVLLKPQYFISYRCVLYK